MDNKLYVVKGSRVGKGPSARFKVLSELFDKRTDLRGTYGPADYLEEAIRWSA